MIAIMKLIGNRYDKKFPTLLLRISNDIKFCRLFAKCYRHNWKVR